MMIKGNLEKVNKNLLIGLKWTITQFQKSIKVHHLSSESIKTFLLLHRSSYTILGRVYESASYKQYVTEK